MGNTKTADYYKQMLMVLEHLSLTVHRVTRLKEKFKKSHIHFTVLVDEKYWDPVVRTIDSGKCDKENKKIRDKR